MRHLQELPDGTVWLHLCEAIEQGVVADLSNYAGSPPCDVERGAEASELAALLRGKYGEGMAQAMAMSVSTANCGVNWITRSGNSIPNSMRIGSCGGPPVRRH